MQSYYRDPQVEEGLRNLIWQSRAGNRLTWLAHADDSQLELVYKPNAFRRRDLAARNFSDRDNCTFLFEDIRLPDWPANSLAEVDYDPFHTQLHWRHPGGARQRVSVITIADENAFALCARQPLLLAISPRGEVTARDGLLQASFHDRGEDIVAFVAFDGYRRNRYRVLADGTHVIQLIEDDVLLIGGEENPAQVTRVLHALHGLTRDQLLARNEALLAHDLASGRQQLTDPDLQRVVDCNRRVVWSGLDAGGACFGALNRIYHLIWVRDGSMTSNHLALAGTPEATRIWAPFLLANPSRLRQEDGSYREEFAQIVGSRWTKTEDDGLFYATWSAYTHFRTTGDDQLVRGDALPLLLRCLDDHLAKCWDDERQLMGSDTLGEDLLAGSPYFGYDTVNGALTPSHHRRDGRQMERCYSLYHQVNTYNVLRMLALLLAQRPDLDHGLGIRLCERADALRTSLRRRFVDQRGQLMSLFVRYDDGSEDWTPWGPGADYWEHAWAVSQGPFFPLPALQLQSARLVVDTWDRLKPYGYCPWNILARSLAEHGLPSAEYRALLADEVADALVETERYPMPGALTEYHGQRESWRALPFSAGSLITSTAAQLLQAQAQGLAVRGGTAVDALDDFRYRLARIAVRAEGSADGVASWRLNGSELRSCLQVPETALLPGGNRIEVRRGPAVAPCRIHGSDAELLTWHEGDTGGHGRLRSAVPIQLRIQGIDAGRVTITDAHGHTLTPDREPLPDTDLCVLHLPAGTLDLAIAW